MLPFSMAKDNANLRRAPGQDYKYTNNITRDMNITDDLLEYMEL